MYPNIKTRAKMVMTGIRETLGMSKDQLKKESELAQLGKKYPEVRQARQDIKEWETLKKVENFNKSRGTSSSASRKVIK